MLELLLDELDELETEHSRSIGNSLSSMAQSDSSISKLVQKELDVDDWLEDEELEDEELEDEDEELPVSSELLLELVDSDELDCELADEDDSEESDDGELELPVTSLELLDVTEDSEVDEAD